MKKYNVLIFPGGTEIGLEIYKALHQCKNIRLFSVGQDFSNHAPYVFKNYFIVDSVYKQGWIKQLNQIIASHQIDYIFPAYDDVIVALAKNAKKINAKIVTSPLKTCLITRSKSKTYSHLSNIIPTPTVYENSDSVDKFPVFIKPDKGQGSQDTHICLTKEELNCVLLKNKNSLILEYLPGFEYTIDCFSDRKYGLQFCKGRIRSRIKNGIAVNSHIIDNPIFLDYAKKISKKLSFRGAWFFQLKVDSNGILKLLEIGPRIAGTMALNRVLGVNFPLLSIYEQERVPITIMTNDIDLTIDRALDNSYKSDLKFECVYIDLDDTLFLNEAINLDLIKFVYKCINEKKRVILLTKHDRDLNQTLKKYRINNLFDEIIHINKDENKVDYIEEINSIFIDDSFSERKKIQEGKKIMTFDCSMLEMLM